MTTFLTLLVLVITAGMTGVAWLGYTVGYSAGRADEAAEQRLKHIDRRSHVRIDHTTAGRQLGAVPDLVIFDEVLHRWTAK